MQDQRSLWNERYLRREGPARPTSWLLDVVDELPTGGRALDVAGGRGVDAAVLAARGFETTVVDISPVALAEVEPPVRAVELDLENEPLPPGPWDVISCFHYLQRDLFPRMVESLATGGMLVVALATRTNLERHDRPSARWLVDAGELPGLVTGLRVVRYEEGWSDPLDPASRHEARLLAERGI